jgi:hypothetical protein
MAGNFWTPMQESISSFGKMINAPVLFDWNTAAARDDVRQGVNPGRTWDSAAGQSVLANTPSNGNFISTAYNTPGAPGGDLTAITDIANKGYDVNGSPITATTQAAANKAAQAAENARITQEGYRTSGQQSVTDTTNKYNADVTGFLGTLEGSQNEINSGRSNNALNQRRSMSNIAGGIRTGLRSGGVQLANMNATDSGAADAMARAYATMGNQQAGDVNNEAALKENELMANQQTLNSRRDERIGQFDAEKEAEVSRIRGDLANKLAVLDASARAEGANGVVDMGMVDAIVNDAVAKFQGINANRQARLGNIKGLSADEVNRKAAEMDQAGIEGTSPFAPTDSLAMTGQQAPGAAISQLPFYTRPKDDTPVTAPLSLLEKDKQLQTL